MDPFTKASPTYIAAQRTNQGGGKGWDLRPFAHPTSFYQTIRKVLGL